MKSFAVLALGASVAVAQSLTDLPACGQTCISNMLAIASAQFGCSLGDVTCYCTNQAFGYGVRDCANEACPTAEEASAVISYGTAYCANAVQSASASGAASTGALAILSSAASAASDAAASATGDASASGGASATGTGGAGAQSTAITTQALVATITSGDSTFETTTGFSTIYSSLSGAAGSAASSVTGSAAAAASSVTGSLASRASSITGSAASAASSLLGSAASRASSVAGAASSAASSLASAGGSALSTGAAPQQTAQAILGAAGMAALFLF
ncbi:CFEM-domain-containing protein [Amniculicola lignicola CBS 123094]|uniref:CFEM-domain-containing protein n=1 Tax=Amniculicola lignicola CBS 123094 TaxID=1392246 RepID=A0A6A5WTM9_9PLEO|nr:CFEM-domain-containing protein [Amniculicola lignicola CBS 123094]